ncbi:lysosome membrane protein 2-like [Oratosquilla oratoria]|uniref:lysosome membrane protein 2-like n=1 Tax=Oratosquilla oratoria TaxID=337810 RepID=UPI003F767FBD
MGQRGCTVCAGTFGLLLLIMGILTAVFFDPLINSFIYKELILKNGTEMFEFWRNPPITPYLRMYFFNVTNKEEFLQGEKPILREIGPYSYREHWQKVNISFHDNGTVSYETQRHYYFDPSTSVGSEDDIVHTLNIPLVSAVHSVRFSPRLMKLALSSMLEVLKAEAFVSHTVGELMWGYEDELLRIAKQILPPEKSFPSDKFGFFYDKNGSTDGVFNVFTGKTDMSKYTKIDLFNQEHYLQFWKTKECNKIEGTDGTSYPPGITRDSTVHMFNKNLCRSLPLVYWHDVEKFGVRGYRFSPPPDVFAYVKDNPENMCYCVDGPPCAGGGVFNISACMMDAPTLISWPHFYQADPSYLNAVVGLQPHPDEHSLYVDISPRTGSPIGAEARLQINVELTKVPEIKAAKDLRSILFPVLWFEDGVTQFPDSIIEKLQMASNMPEVTKASMLWALLGFGTALLVATLVTIVANHFHLSIFGTSNSADITTTPKDVGHSNPVVPTEPEKVDEP